MNWKGKWIWIEERQEHNVYVMARKTFSLRGRPKKAEIRITADSRYKLWVNGTFVCRGPARFYPESIAYDTVDVAPHLVRGKNCIAVLAHNFGESNLQYVYRGRAGITVDSEVVPSSDRTWKIKRARAWEPHTQRVSLQLGFQENFDARLETTGWTEPDFDDTAWKSAQESGPAGTRPWTGMEERGIPLLREEVVAPERLVTQYTGRSHPDYLTQFNIARTLFLETRKPVERGKFSGEPGGPLRVEPTGKGRFAAVLVDFGRTVAGHLRLKVSGAGGGEMLDLFYSERRTGKQVYITEPKEKYDPAFADRIRLRRGRQEYETFNMRGFRYLLVVARDVTKPIRIEELSLNRVGYPVERRGAFECSDRLLNRIWKTSGYTLENCMFDAYVDCPWREQAQWWGDALVEAAVTAYAFGDMRLLKRGIRQAAQSQGSDGLMLSSFPAESHQYVLSDYNVIWLLSLHDYYMYTGDAAPLRKWHETMVKMLRWFEKKAGDLYAMGPTPEIWQFLDWAPLNKKHLSATYTLFYLLGLQTAARISRVVGKTAQARTFQAQAGRVTRAMDRFFWDPKRKVWREAFDLDKGKRLAQISQQANSLAVLAGLRPRNGKTVGEIILRASGSRDGKLVDGSTYFHWYVLNALFRLGRGQEALQTIRRRWGDMLRRGATTFWEHWPGVMDECASRCHAWSASPLVFLSREVLGVRPAAPGWEKVSIKPQRFDLEWAAGSVPTPYGDIHVRWERSGGRIKTDLELPRGVRRV